MMFKVTAKQDDRSMKHKVKNNCTKKLPERNIGNEAIEARPIENEAKLAKYQAIEAKSQKH